MFKFLKEKIQSIFKSEDEEIVQTNKKDKIKQKEKQDKKNIKTKEKKEKKSKEITKTSQAVKESKEVIDEEIRKASEKEAKKEIKQKKKELTKIKLEEEIKEKEKEKEEKVKNENKEKESKEKEEIINEKKEEKKSFFSFFKRKKDESEISEVKEEAPKEEIHDKEHDEKIEEEIFQEKIEKEEKEADKILHKIDAEVKEEIKKEEKGILSKIGQKFASFKIDKDKFNEIFEKLEIAMLESNVALEVIDKIKEDMEKSLLNKEIKKDKLEDEIKKVLKNSLEEILLPPFDLFEKINEKSSSPFVILFFGINGAGKTTTIAKIAYKLKQKNISCVIAAADTFRAASIEQLQKHGENIGVKIIHQDYGADPSAVGFDAIKYAKAHGIKVVLIDTAGRMHTKDNLLKEMEKIVRVTSPDLKIFVAESITGNDATIQAKNFSDTAGIDGTILSKADVDEKGGTSISIGFVTGKPILYLGVGQEYEDLDKFSPQNVIKSLGL